MSLPRFVATIAAARMARQYDYRLIRRARKTTSLLRSSRLAPGPAPIRGTVDYCGYAKVLSGLRAVSIASLVRSSDQAAHRLVRRKETPLESRRGCMRPSFTEGRTIRAPRLALPG